MSWPPDNHSLLTRVLPKHVQYQVFNQSAKAIVASLENVPAKDCNLDLGDEARDLDQNGANTTYAPPVISGDATSATIQIYLDTNLISGDVNLEAYEGERIINSERCRGQIGPNDPPPPPRASKEDLVSPSYILLERWLVSLDRISATLTCFSLDDEGLRLMQENTLYTKSSHRLPLVYRITNNDFDSKRVETNFPPLFPGDPAISSCLDGRMIIPGLPFGIQVYFRANCSFAMSTIACASFSTIGSREAKYKAKHKAITRPGTEAPIFEEDEPLGISHWPDNDRYDPLQQDISLINLDGDKETVDPAALMLSYNIGVNVNKHKNAYGSTETYESQHGGNLSQFHPIWASGLYMEALKDNKSEILSDDTIPKQFSSNTGQNLKEGPRTRYSSTCTSTQKFPRNVAKLPSGRRLASSFKTRAHHTKESWEAQRPVIESLYCSNKLPLKKVKEIMDRRGFIASEREYYPRIKDWGLAKNIQGEDMTIMYRKMLQRKVDQCKETAFTIHKQPVDLKKIHRFVKRANISPSQFPSKATPGYILAITPSVPKRYGNVTFPWAMSPHRQHLLRVSKEAARKASVPYISMTLPQSSLQETCVQPERNAVLTNCGSGLAQRDTASHVWWDMELRSRLSSATLRGDAIDGTQIVESGSRLSSVVVNDEDWTEFMENPVSLEEPASLEESASLEHEQLQYNWDDLVFGLMD